jgi:hypothetical protein
LEYLNGEAFLAEMQVRRCALQQNPRADVCYGSKADMATTGCDVCFPPESGHCLRLYDCRPCGPENADKSLRRRY